MLDRVRQIGKDAGTATAIVMALGLLIGMFGGRVYPWWTPAEAAAARQEQLQTTASILESLRKTNETLDRAAATIEKISRKLDRNGCKDANEKLRLATDTLKRDPSNPVAYALKQTALDAVFAIDGCTQDVR